MARHALQFTPADTTRRQQKALRRELARAQQDDTPARTSRRDRGLPEPAVPGPFGPGILRGGYWNLAKCVVPAHQATSQHIAGIYPFVADSGLGHRGPIRWASFPADVDSSSTTTVTGSSAVPASSAE